MRLRSVLASLAVFALATIAWWWVRLYPGPAVQDALSAHAPGLTLGGRVPTSSTHYDLRIAPYLGYRDSAFVAPSGLQDLWIRVNRYVDEGDQTISPNARIVEVSLRSPDAAVTTAVEADLVRRFGEPERLCYVTFEGQRMRTAYWSGWFGRGVQLFVPRGSTGKGLGDRADTVAGTATVTFGGKRLTPDQLEPCS